MKIRGSILVLVVLSLAFSLGVTLQVAFENRYLYIIWASVVLVGVLLFFLGKKFNS